nr:type II toxin-antitoxin system Phd/YefM family antitoxin [Sedimentibacter sp.]
MLDDISVKEMLNSIVPISRFNKGEANKIFNEVNNSGYKIVIKNNKPTCILISPEQYEKMMETIEDYKLFVDAEKRMRSASEADFISHEQLMKTLNIQKGELEDIEVEIE